MVTAAGLQPRSFVARRGSELGEVDARRQREARRRRVHGELRDAPEALDVAYHAGLHNRAADRRRPEARRRVGQRRPSAGAHLRSASSEGGALGRRDREEVPQRLVSARRGGGTAREARQSRHGSKSIHSLPHRDARHTPTNVAHVKTATGTKWHDAGRPARALMSRSADERGAAVMCPVPGAVAWLACSRAAPRPAAERP